MEDGDEESTEVGIFFFKDLWKGEYLRKIGGGRLMSVMMGKKATVETDRR